MAINTGVNATKLIGYAVLAPETGVDVTKLIGYAVLAPETGIDVTKLIGYAALAPTSIAPPLWPAFVFADGFVGVPYSQAWDMPTSALTVTYTVLSGSLPPGLSLSALTGNQAEISGSNPTTVGTYPFVLRATNLYGFADKSFSITINTVPATVQQGNYGYIV